MIIGKRYQLLRPPIEGGMGAIYICQDMQQGGVILALKVLKNEYYENIEARDRFLREATIWINLGHHENVVQAYRVDRLEEQRLCLVLEYVPASDNRHSSSLRSWIQNGQPVEVKRAMSFALQIASGMDYATKKMPNLVHRDLKPENILVGVDGVAKVTDFGLASVLGHAKDTGQVKQVIQFEDIRMSRTCLTGPGWVGTPLYMAPEQWAQKTLNQRTDIYAFGCILYEMLTGFPPVSGRSIDELEYRHCSGEAERAILPGQLPQNVQRLVRTCLSQNPRVRPESWDQVLRRINGGIGYSISSGNQPNYHKEKPPLAIEQVDKAKSLIQLGISHIEINQLDVAINYFEQAITICSVPEVSNYFETKDVQFFALDGIYQIYSKNNDTHRASATLDQMLVLNPENPLLWNRKGILESEQNHYKEAIECYNRSLEIDPSNVEAWYNKGLELGMHGEYSESIACFDQVIKANPADENALYNKGLSCENCQRYAEALDCYDLVLRLNPHNVPALENRGDCLARLERYHEAADSYRRCTQYMADQPHLWIKQANCEEEAGQWANAIRSYKNLLMLSPEEDLRKAACQRLRELVTRHPDPSRKVLMKDFTLDKTDQAYGIEDDPTIVSVRKAAPFQNELRQMLIEEMKLVSQEEFMRHIQKMMGPGSFVGEGTTERMMEAGHQVRLRKLEIYLTLVSCNIVQDDNNSLFRFVMLDGIPAIDMTEEEFTRKLGQLPGLVEREIHEKVLQMNPEWS